MGLPYALGSSPDLVSMLSVNAFPTVVLMDPRDGKIVSYEVGARGEPALRTGISPNWALVRARPLPKNMKKGD